MCAVQLAGSCTCRWYCSGNVRWGIGCDASGKWQLALACWWTLTEWAGTACTILDGCEALYLSSWLLEQCMHPPVVPLQALQGPARQ